MATPRVSTFKVDSSIFTSVDVIRRQTQSRNSTAEHHRLEISVTAVQLPQDADSKQASKHQ